MEITFNTTIPFKPFRLFIDKLMNPIWSATAYGNQKWIRKMGFYPRFLPLCVATDHAPGIPSEPSKTYFTNAPFTFFHSKSYCFWLQKFCTNKLRPFFSPFVFYKNTYGIKLDDNREGSIYFYAHGNSEVKPTKNIKSIISDLTELPNSYQPVTICLHYQDLINDVHREFLNNNFKVICMGNPNDWNFIENYYNNLKKFKFSLSSNFSSYSLYCVNFGLPFGLIGEPSLFFNDGDTSISEGIYSGYLENSEYSNGFKKLFQGLPGDTVTNDQLNFVNLYLGVEEPFSRFKFSYYLYASLLISFFNLNSWKSYLSYIKRNL